MASFLKKLRITIAESRLIEASKELDRERGRQPQNSEALKLKLQKLTTRREEYTLLCEEYEKAHPDSPRLFRADFVKKSAFEKDLEKLPPPEPDNIFSLPPEPMIGKKPMQISDIKDENGRVRAPSPDELVRLATGQQMKILKPTINASIEQNQPIKGETEENFSQGVGYIQRSQLRRTQDGYLKGVIPDTVAGHKAKIAEFLTGRRELEQQQLAAEIKHCFGDGPNMQAPVAGQEFQRRSLLQALKMDDRDLTPPLSTLEEHLIHLGKNKTAWEQFLVHFPQGRKLQRLAQACYKGEEDRHDWDNHMREEMARREGKDGDEFRKSAKAYKYVLDWNARIKALPDSSMDMSVVTASGIATHEAIHAATGKKLDEKAIGNEVYTRIIDSYEKSGNPPDVSPVVKDTAAEARDEITARLTKANAQVALKADTLSTAAAASLVLSRGILSMATDRFINASEIEAKAEEEDKDEDEDEDEEEEEEDKPLSLFDEVRQEAKTAVRKIFNGQGTQPLPPPRGDLDIFIDRLVGQVAFAITANMSHIFCTNNDLAAIAAAKGNIAAAAAVATAVAIAIYESQNQALKNHAFDIAEAAAMAVVDGNAAVTQAIRHQVKSHATLDNEKSLTHLLNEAAQIAMTTQKAESAARTSTEAKAIQEMIAIGMPKTAAEYAAHNLSNLETVDEQSVQKALTDARNQVNHEINCIRQNFPDDNPYNTAVFTALRQNYLDHGFRMNGRTRSQVVQDIIQKTWLKHYPNHALSSEYLKNTTNKIIQSIGGMGPVRPTEALSPTVLNRITDTLVKTYQGFTEESCKALEKETETDPMVRSGAKAVIVSNGRSHAVDHVVTNRNKARVAIIDNFSHEDTILRTSISVVITASVTNANHRFNAEIEQDTCHALCKAVLEFYTKNRSPISWDDFNRFESVQRIAEEVRLALWKKINASIQIHQGMQVGRQAKIGTAHGEMASATAAVAIGTGIKTAAALEISRQIAKAYKDNQEKPMDEPAVRRIIRESVSRVNARTSGLRNSVFPEKELRYLGMDILDRIAEGIETHYLKTGSLSLAELTEIFQTHARQTPPATTIAALHRRMQTLAEQQEKKPEGVIEYVKPTIFQEDAIIKMAVAFSKKTDPLATGTQAAVAATWSSCDPVRATAVAALATHGSGERDGAKPNLTDTSNATYIAYGGAQIASNRSSARNRISRAGTAAAAAAAIYVHHKMQTNNWFNILNAALPALPSGTAAKESINVSLGLPTRTQHHLLSTGLELKALVIGAEGAARNIGQNVAEAICSFNRVNPNYMDSIYETLKDCVRTAALHAVAIQEEDYEHHGELKTAVPRVDAHTVSKSVAVAGATWIAATNIGCTPEQAKSLSLAVSGVRTVRGGADSIEAALRSHLAAHPELKLSDRVQYDMIQTVRGSYAIQCGIEAGTSGPDIRDLTLRERAVRIVEAAARAAGATDEEAQAAGQETNAVIDKMSLVMDIIPADDNASRLPSDEAKTLSWLATASLVKKGRMDAAFGASAALTAVLCEGDYEARIQAIYEEDDKARIQAIYQVADGSQVKNEERELPEPPEGLDKTQRKKAGQLYDSAEIQQYQNNLLQARQKLESGGKPLPTLQTIDTSRHLNGGNRLDLMHADRWKISFADAGDDKPREYTLKRKFPEITKKLQQCCKDGKNFANADTLKRAIDRLNISKYDAQITTDSNGGMTVTLKRFSKKQVERLLEEWVKVSQAAMNTSVDLSGTVVRKDGTPSTQGIGVGF
jgi:hypothetical protein